jgi:anaerobic magnesium-protoporphyrin IX monomethyl ester cyclase
VIQILLVQLKYPSSPFPGPNLPVGLGYIAEQLELNNIQYDIIDLSIDSVETLFSCLTAAPPAYIGFSMMSLDIAIHYDLARKIKTSFPHIKIIAGGPHISFVCEKALEECQALDFGVVHEGEYTIVELLKGAPLESIKGLLYRKCDGSVIYTGNRAFIENLNDIPFPKYKKFKLTYYGETIAIASSRGCPFSCTFCGAFLSMGRRWRARSAVNIVEEMEYWLQKGYTSFNFIDSNFFMSKERIIALCDILSGKNLSITISSDGMRAKDADPTMLKKLQMFGLKSVAIGIESANDDILNSIKKGETLEDIDSCLKLLLELDINVVAFFIIGLPGETIEHVINSFSFPFKYPNISNAYYFNPNPLIGTELFQYAKQNNMIRGSDKQILDNMGGMSNEILLETEELNIPVRIKLLEFSKHVSRLVEMRHWLYRNRNNMAESEYNNVEMELHDMVNKILLSTATAGANMLKYNVPFVECDNIVTHLTKDEKYKLKELATIVQGSTYVELGSYLGASSCFIAMGIEALQNDAQLYCVDTWENEGMAEGLRDTYSEFIANIEMFKNIIVPLRGKSEIIAEDFDKEIDFLFVDAGHDYVNVMTDVRSWFPKLKKGALVVFHDTGWADGVKKVVSELVKPIAYDVGELPNMYWARIEYNQNKTELSHNCDLTKIL